MVNPHEAPRASPAVPCLLFDRGLRRGIEGVMSKIDYGTAPHEEIIAGIQTATKIAEMIRAVPSPAVRDMIKKLIAMIRVTP